MSDIKNDLNLFKLERESFEVMMKEFFLQRRYSFLIVPTMK